MWVIPIPVHGNSVLEVSNCFLNVTVNRTKEKLPKCKLDDKLSGSSKMSCV